MAGEMTRPALQEIADAPHSIGVLMIREHYDPTWPLVTCDEPETDEDDLSDFDDEEWYG